MTPNRTRFGFPMFLAGSALLVGACGAAETVAARVDVIDQTTQALVVGDLASVNGTYGALCTDRTGNWSVEIASGATLDDAPLTVVLNDAACVLTLVSLHTTSGVIVAAPAITLTTSYKPVASSFGSPAAFYANARLSAATFAANFVITIPFSDDPALATADNTAQFSVVIATATAQAVPAPDYGIDAPGLIVRTDVNDVVQTVTGSANLSAGAVTGQRYVVLAVAGLVTYEQIDAAFTAGTDVAITPGIPAADFTLVGVDLTSNAVRTLIISNTQDGIASYQSFEITFHPAP